MNGDWCFTQFHVSVVANGHEDGDRTPSRGCKAQSETSRKLSGAQKTRSASIFTNSKNGNPTKSSKLSNIDRKPEIYHAEPATSNSYSAKTKSSTNLRLITELRSDPNAPGKYSWWCHFFSNNQKDFCAR